MTSLGKDAPDRIVSYLRSHPQVNYVVLSVSNALGAGLPAALKAAGLADKVKLVGQSGDTLTFQDMAAGNIESVVPFDYYAVDYLMLDALARHFAGVPVEQAQPPPWIVTPDNMPARGDRGPVPGRRELPRRVQEALGQVSLKLGLNTGYWAAAAPPPSALESVQEAERLGFDSVWTSEAYGCDVLTPLAWWGSHTEKIRLGTAIMQMSARRPTAAAMAAMTMDHLSGGRFVLGLGVSGPQVVEGWYGEPFAKPLARTREYVSIVRDVVARQEPVVLRRPPLPAAAQRPRGRDGPGQAAEVDAAPAARRACRSTWPPRARRTSR